MNNKKGISLIVLVITILVMIILAGVVIVSLQDNNPIWKAKTAKLQDSVSSIRGTISQYAATAQASDKAANEMKKLVNASANPQDSENFGNKGVACEIDGYKTYFKVKKGSTMINKLGSSTETIALKDALGVDPTVDGGAFYMNSNGNTIFVPDTDTAKLIFTEAEYKATSEDKGTNADTLKSGVIEKNGIVFDNGAKK